MKVKGIIGKKWQRLVDTHTHTNEEGDVENTVMAVRGREAGTAADVAGNINNSSSKKNNRAGGAQR